MMGFYMFALIFLFHQIAESVIKGVSVVMMNDLVGHYQIIRVSFIPNIVGTMDIPALACGGIVLAFLVWNPNKEIFLTTLLSAARFPATLEIWIFRAGNSLTDFLFDFLSHPFGKFVSTSTSTTYRGLVLCMNAGEFYLANRATFSGFHVRNLT